jgi:uroporphyrinogen-III synthase
MTTRELRIPPRRTVAVTRDEPDDGPLTRELLARGAYVLCWPSVRIEPPEDRAPLDAARKTLDTYDWVTFTSARAVRAVVEEWHGSAPARVRIAVVGEGTARALRTRGWPIHLEAEAASSAGLAQALITQGVGGARVLFPSSSLAGSSLVEELTAAGARVDVVIAYRTIALPLGDEARLWSGALVSGREPRVRVDALAFTSPSAVIAWRFALGSAGMSILGRRVLVAAIGDTTARSLREAGCQDLVVARTSTFAGLAEHIIEELVPVENA